MGMTPQEKLLAFLEWSKKQPGSTITSREEMSRVLGISYKKFSPWLNGKGDCRYTKVRAAMARLAMMDLDEFEDVDLDWSPPLKRGSGPVIAAFVEESLPAETPAALREAIRGMKADIRAFQERIDLIERLAGSGPAGPGGPGGSGGSSTSGGGEGMSGGKGTTKTRKPGDGTQALPVMAIAG